MFNMVFFLHFELLNENKQKKIFPNTTSLICWSASVVGTAYQACCSASALWNEYEIVSGWQYLFIIGRKRCRKNRFIGEFIREKKYYEWSYLMNSSIRQSSTTPSSEAILNSAISFVFRRLLVLSTNSSTLSLHILWSPTVLLHCWW